MSEKSLPKPFGRYFYSSGDGWEVFIENTEKGWNWHVKDREGLRSFGCHWKTKESAFKIALDALEESSGTREVKATNSSYTYRTYPQIKIWSKRSKWGWSCGEHSGIEKTKSKALAKACKYRKDDDGES